jgi:hypothetical protein
MGNLAASFGAWLIKIATGDFLGKVLAVLSKTDNGALRLKEIEAAAAIAQGKNETELAKAIIAARLQTQTAKMNWPVFWILIVAMMGPPILMLWSVWAYNIFWWDHGIWPQGWAIADFPPSIKPWAQAAVDWLYDPWGPPSGVGAAVIAGRFTRR